ncbi:MAG: hypothetical protein Q9M36_14830 [Sulfurovum sp.]|nr:hypothetical protein [Sulfurovum sp.]
MEYYQKAKTIAEDNNLAFQKSSILGNIGVIYSAKGDLDFSKKYYNEALSLFEEIGYAHGVEVIKNNLNKL